MNKAWKDFMAGWREVRWAVRFCFYLAVLIPAAMLLADLIDSIIPIGRKFADHQLRDLQILFILIAGWTGLLLATLNPKKAFLPSYRRSGQS